MPALAPQTKLIRCRDAVEATVEGSALTLCYPAPHFIARSRADSGCCSNSTCQIDAHDVCQLPCDSMRLYVCLVAERHRPVQCMHRLFGIHCQLALRRPHQRCFVAIGNAIVPQSRLCAQEQHECSVRHFERVSGCSLRTPGPLASSSAWTVSVSSIIEISAIFSTCEDE